MLSSARLTLASLVARAVVARLAGLWLALLVLGAVILGPNGLDARDITRGMRATPIVAALALALWSAVHVRAARVLEAQEFAFVRALPLSTVDRLATLAAPTLAPHALVGGFFARGEGAAVGLVAALISAAGTVALRALARRIEARPRGDRPSPSGLLLAHARFALRAAPSSIARSSALALACTLLATVAVHNTRIAPTAQSSLATVLLLVASGAVSASLVTIVRESEQSLALLLATQPRARSSARIAGRIATWALPALVGASCAAMASSALGVRAACASAVLYAAQWLSVATIVEQSARRAIEPVNAAAGATIAAVILALMATPSQSLAAACVALALALAASVRA